MRNIRNNNRRDRKNHSLFDDNLQICKEAESGGILAYHLHTTNRDGAYWCDRLGKARLRHDPSHSFPEAVDKFIAEYDNGTVAQKIAVLRRTSTW